MLDITGKRSTFLIISEIIILIGIIALVVFGLKPGIEFSSGSMLTISFEQEVAQSELKEELVNLGYDNAIIQRTGAGDFFIRTQELTAAERLDLEEHLSARFGALTEREFYSVSSMVAAETVSNAIIAVAVAAVLAVQPRAKGDATVVLKSGGEVPCSRQYREALMARLRQ